MEDRLHALAVFAGCVSMNHPVTVAGIPLPTNALWFLVVIAVHVAAGLLAVVAGIAAMMSAKAPGRHPLAGTVYFWSLNIVCLTMAGIVGWRWPTDNALGGLGVIAFATGFVGRRSHRRARSGWRCVHIPCMGASYVALLTAFYVDNGAHLPLWNRLPQLAFWLLPGAIGFPLIGFTWARYCPRRRMSVAMKFSTGIPNER